MRNHKGNDPRVYARERANGKTVNEIARDHGVTHQAVSDGLKRIKAQRFRGWDDKRCIYKNLRQWLNDNQFGLSELVIMMGFAQSGTNTGRLRSWLKGECYPSKKNIDRLLLISGLTYEQLWEVG